MPKGVYKRIIGINFFPEKQCFRKGNQINKGRKGIITYNKGKKGLQTAWNKGKPRTWESNGGFKKGENTGNKNINWKGDKVSYRSLHKWVIYYKGKPNFCEFCGKKRTTQKNVQWANIDHKYKRSLTDWLGLCVSCHRKYDKRRNELCLLQPKRKEKE